MSREVEVVLPRGKDESSSDRPVREKGCPSSGLGRGLCRNESSACVVSGGRLPGMLAYSNSNSE